MKKQKKIIGGMSTLIVIPFLQSAAPKQISKGEVDSSPDPQGMLSSDALGHSCLTQLSSLRTTLSMPVRFLSTIKGVFPSLPLPKRSVNQSQQRTYLCPVPRSVFYCKKTGKMEVGRSIRDLTPSDVQIWRKIITKDQFGNVSISQ